MLAAALDSLEDGVEHHYWCKDVQDCVVIYHNMTHTKLNAHVNAYFKSHPPCYDERKHFLELKESLRTNESTDCGIAADTVPFAGVIVVEVG
jgi:hypothetical protein